MPRLTIAKVDYDQIVWKAVADRPPQSHEEHVVADALLAKLEEVGEPNLETNERGEPIGIAEEAPYVLSGESAEVDLTDEEVVVLRARLAHEVRRHSTRRLRSLLSLTKPLGDAADAAEAARRQAEADRRAQEVDQELAATRAELESVQQELGTARTQLDGIVAEIEIQERRRELAEMEAQRAAGGAS